MSEPPPPPPAEPASGWDAPWDRPRNTGTPAATPELTSLPGEEPPGQPGTQGPWAPPDPSSPPGGSGASGGWGGQGQWARPAFAPPDPAAVSGPPWPALVAVGPYAPPRLIRWPIVVGAAIFAVYLLSFIVLRGSTSLSHAAWLADNQSTITALNNDQRAINSDNPTRTGDAATWLDDWRKFHNDAAAASALPNPGGSATAPWREMINNYFNGSSTIIQAIQTQNRDLLQEAEKDLSAGDRAAAAFNKAMGISPP